MINPVNCTFPKFQECKNITQIYPLIIVHFEEIVLYNKQNFHGIIKIRIFQHFILGKN